jgi:hypothetical protein
MDARMGRLRREAVSGDPEAAVKLHRLCLRARDEEAKGEAFRLICSNGSAWQIYEALFIDAITNPRGRA